MLLSLRSLRGWTVLLLALPVVSCASVDAAQMPQCEPLEEQASLATASCSASPEAVRFEQQLSESMGRDLGSLLVRVTLDEQARLGAMCVDGRPVPGGHRKRANLAARFEEFAAIDGAPECLAGRRIDVNRRKAMQAEIKRRTNRCQSEFQSVLAIQSASNGTQLAQHEFEECLDYRANWITLYAIGRQQPYIFGKPEVAEPENLEASATRAKCNKRDRPKDIAACIEADGWELLE